MYIMSGLPGSSDSQEFTCSVGVRSLGQEDPLEEGLATHFGIQYYRRTPMDRGAWQATVQGVTEPDTTE